MAQAAHDFRKRLARVARIRPDLTDDFGIREAALLRLVQPLHLWINSVVGFIVLLIEIGFSLFLARRVLVVILVDVHLVRWVILHHLLDELKIVVTKSPLGARGGFSAVVVTEEVTVGQGGGVEGILGRVADGVVVSDGTRCTEIWLHGMRIVVIPLTEHRLDRYEASRVVLCDLHLAEPSSGLPPRVELLLRRPHQVIVAHVLRMRLLLNGAVLVVHVGPGTGCQDVLSSRWLVSPEVRDVLLLRWWRILLAHAFKLHVHVLDRSVLDNLRPGADLREG